VQEGQLLRRYRCVTVRIAVLCDPPGDARVSTSEIFGPLVCAYPYDDIDDAIA